MDSEDKACNDLPWDAARLLPDVEPINSFALVTYLPEPLGRFLDDLRRELVPGCTPRAHVTILPPRPLPMVARDAWSEIDRHIRDFPAFEIEATEVSVFQPTSVVYIELGSGVKEIKQLHDLLTAGPVGNEEIYPYHPHITLAQDFGADQVEEISRRARLLWDGFSGRRRFTADTITFVQNTLQNRWLDLAQRTLPSPVGAEKP